MSPCWSSIILQRPKQGICVELVSWAGQVTAAIVAAEVIAVRRNRAAVVDNIGAQVASVQNRVFNLKYPQPIVNCAAVRPIIATQGAITDRALPAGPNAAAM